MMKRKGWSNWCKYYHTNFKNSMLYSKSFKDIHQEIKLIVKDLFQLSNTDKTRLLKLFADQMGEG